MMTSLECVPCLLRQATEAIRLCPNTEEANVLAMRELLLASTSLDFAQPPPALAAALQAQLRAITECDDPYREAKRRFHAMALELLPALREEANRSCDPFGAAVRLAIAGNIIDLGAKTGLTETEVRTAASSAMNQLLLGSIAGFRRAVARARSILYLCDNAGEIVFDRVLIEQLAPARVTVAVRGGAVINDAVREDAERAGLHLVAEVIDSGARVPGTILEQCSADFRRRFSAADLVVAKGQGNFESLKREPAPLVCLFRVKCSVVAEHSGYPVGSHVVWMSPRLKRKGVGPTMPL